MIRMVGETERASVSLVVAARRMNAEGVHVDRIVVTWEKDGVSLGVVVVQDFVAAMLAMLA